MAGSTLSQGRYQLLAQIGRGGMGQVWRARDEALGRLVAIKCLRPLGLSQARPDDPALRTLRERFRREARVAAGLQHRGVTVVHDFGEDDGVLYLVMELLEGHNLSQLLDGQRPAPLPETEVADVADQLAAALAYTHGRGIVHRDLKPANVVRLPDGTVKICDFGIARIARDAELSQRLTGEGTGMGTPHYMSPEQLAGGPVDHRSDLYSLGCVLYELATGTPPFDFPDPWAVLVGHRDTPPDPPRTRRPDLSAPLEELILTLLAKNPADRPPDVTGPARRLALTVVPSAAVLAPAPAPFPEATESADTRVPPQRPPGGAKHPPDSHPGGPRRLHAQPTDATPDASRDPSPEYLAGLASRYSAGRGLGRLGRWEEALTVHRAVAAERAAVLGEHHADTLVSRYQAGYALGRLGRWAEALAEHHAVAAARARLWGPRHPDTLAARYETAVALGRLGRPAEALEVYRELVAAWTHSQGRSHRETLRARHGLGVSLGRLGRWAEALAEARDVCALRGGTLGPDHPDTLVSRREIAVALGWLGRWAEARAEYHRVRRAREDALGPDHPDALALRADEAHCLEQLGRADEADELLRQGSMLRERETGDG